MKPNGEKKINIFLPIEIKPREFVSKVLLAAELAELGARVYVGKKSEIDFLIRKVKKTNGGGYLYKSGNLRGREKFLKSKEVKIFVLDEEMGVAVRDPEYFFNRRIVSPEIIDKYFVINSCYRDLVKTIRPELSGKVITTGWPRVDSWRKKYQYIYKNEIGAIKKEHGDFVLFSSDFGFLNNDRVAEEERKMLINGFDVREVDKQKVSWNKKIQAFEEFVSCLNNIDNFIHRKVIVRPHPAEDHDVWKQKSKSWKNIKVVYEGEITPWVHASLGVVHCGCTTAVQAYITSKKVGIINNSHSDATEICKRVSLPINNTEELISFVNEAEAGAENDGKLELLGNEIFIPREGSCKLVAKEIMKCNMKKEVAIKINKSLRFRNLIKSSHFYQYVRGVLAKKREKAMRKRKFPDDISAKEISNILGVGYKYKELLHNVCVIEK